MLKTFVMVKRICAQCKKFTARGGEKLEPVKSEEGPKTVQGAGIHSNRWTGRRHRKHKKLFWR